MSLDFDEYHNLKDTIQLTGKTIKDVISNPEDAFIQSWILEFVDGDSILIDSDDGGEVLLRDPKAQIP